MVGRINGQIGTIDWTPISYSTRKLDDIEAVTLYRLADAAIITPIRDGMNLTAYEFVLCQKNSHAPLILSEFAGASQSLSGSRLVNPWNLRDFADAIYEVLSMSTAEKKLKHQYNFKYALTHTGYFWAKTFLQEMLRISPEIKIPQLSFTDIKRAYESAESRLILLDYDGTLAPISKFPSQAKPSPSMIFTLTTLCADPRNVVFVISGRDRPTLEGTLRRKRQQ